MTHNIKVMKPDNDCHCPYYQMVRNRRSTLFLKHSKT